MTVKPEYAVVENEDFGFKHLEPIPSTADVQAFYENEYYDLVNEGARGPDIARLMQGGQEADSERSWQEEILYEDVLQVLCDYAPERKVLEVGCGTGDLLVYLRDHGFEVSGVEIAATAADFAQRRDLNVAATAFEDFCSTTEQRFDAILFMNVLEQTRNPVDIVGLAHDLLVPGGVIIVRSGNEYNPLQLAATKALELQRWWVSTPDQINYFSFESMERLLTSVGFDVRYQQSDFPMEMFLLMGKNYVADKDQGASCHKQRVQFELNLPSEVRRSLYQAFAQAGVGRCMFMCATKADAER